MLTSQKVAKTEFHQKMTNLNQRLQHVSVQLMELTKFVNPGISDTQGVEIEPDNKHIRDYKKLQSNSKIISQWIVKDLDQDRS